MNDKNKPLHQLTQSETEGHHPLCDLAKEAGYCGLSDWANDGQRWNLTIQEAENQLRGELEAMQEAALEDIRCGLRKQMEVNQ